MTRIAVVEHGDYAAAVKLINRGETEPYFGMGYTIRVLEALFDGHPHLVISLDAPPYREGLGKGKFVGLPFRRLPRPLPGTLAAMLWARKIIREMRRFQPTHLLLRTGGVLGWQILRYCVANRISTLVILASTFDDPRARNRYVNRRFAQLLNHACVSLVGNHRRPATDSMVRFGVGRRKVVAWDWPTARHPRDWPGKRLLPGAPRQILYVGSVSEAKGVSDLIDAIGILSGRGCEVRLTVVGAGPDLDRMRVRARNLEGGAIRFLGQVDNETVFRLMRESTLVCVPSRHAFSEGLPMSLTEALASRTPVVASDHPVLREAFRDGVGLRFFQAGDPPSLAKAVEDVLGSEEGYEELSRSTAEAYAGAECSATFGELVERWRGSFGDEGHPAY